MKIAAKISLSFLVTGVILTTAGATVFYMIARNALHNEIVQHLDTTSQSRKNHIETYLRMLEISVSQLSKSTILESFLKTVKDDPRRKEAFEAAMQRLKRTKEVNSSIYEFLLLDKNGMVVASSGETGIGRDKSADAYFTGGQKGVYIKDAYYSEVIKRPLIGTAAPVTDSQTGELLGVLAARVELDDLNRITTDRTGLGKTGEIYIVNKHGYMITPSRFLQGTFLKKKIDTQNYRACVLKHDEAKEHPPEIIGTDYTGDVTLGTHACIPKMQWSLLTEINLDEANAPLRMMLAVALAIIFLVPLAAWLAGVIVSSAITAPIHRLHRGTEIIGSGDLDHKVGTPARDEIGQLSRAFDTMTDDLKKKIISIDMLNKEITERKQAQKALKEAKAFTESTLNAITDIFYSFDLSGKFLSWNKTFSRVSGYSDQELSSKKPTDFFSGEDIKRIAEAVERIYKEGTSKVEANFVLKDGRQIPFEFTGSILKDSKGNIIGFSGTGRDLTERKDAEKKVAEAMEAKSKFLSMVSHELRTPMTAIKEGIGIVLDGSAGSINEEQKDFLDTAKRNVDRLSRLINDVLDYQRLEAGRTTFVMKRGSIGALVDDVVKVMLPAARGKNLALETRIEPGLPDTFFDMDKLTQVLINFINNAVKFTDTGSVSVAASRDADSIVVSVTDTGVGIKEEDIPKLFQDFSQLDEGRARKNGSTGLGLAISKKIIEGHHGDVWVESEPGKGSEFKLTIPIRIKFRVLVIDDDKDVLDVCKKVLKKEDYEVACSESGLKGLEMAQKDRPDILILDMRLGDINGYEIIGRLRSSKEMATIPILAMSGYIEELGKLEDKREDSALLSIAKPFKLEEMAAMVRGLLKQGA